MVVQNVMTTLYKRKGSGCCVAVGCGMKAGTNMLSTIKMYKFPKDCERREQWENAVHRENWKSTPYSQLCNRHFTSGKPSNDPLHPDFIPSVFLHNVNSDPSMQRFKRHQKRLKSDELDSSSNINGSISSDVVTEEPQPRFKEVGTMTDLTNAEIVRLENQCAAYKSNIKLMQENEGKNTLSNKIMACESMLKFYCKLPNVHILFALLQYIIDNWKPNTPTMLDPAEQLLLVLMKLRLGLLNQDLAYRFKVGTGTVSCLFREWVTRMSQVLSVFLVQPTPRKIRKHLPQCFKQMKLNNISSIIDCSEIFIQRPYMLNARAQTYSTYKHHNTVKFLISCSPTGTISFISNLYGGRISDKEISKMSGFLDTIRQGDVILADRGFRIEEFISLKHAKIIVPSFTKGKKQLSGAEVMTSRQIARVRVHIERCIGRLKSYGIMKTIWPSTFLYHSLDGKKSTGDCILIVLAALCNLSKALIKK